MIYLDNAATTLKKPRAVKVAMLSALETCSNAGRGGYAGAVAAADRIFTARERVAELFNLSDVSQVAFTHNATYALNFAIKGLAKEGECVISGYEHNSVVRPISALRKKGLEMKIANGRLFDEEDMIRSFKKAITERTKFAVCTYVSNVFGYILPIYEIDEVCRRAGVPLVIDASQAAGSVSLDFARLSAAVCVCAPGHKGLYGPQGTGIFICSKADELNTLVEGGTGSVSSEIIQPEFMPDRFESGTQNSVGIAGLSEGIKYVLSQGEDNILRHERNVISLIAKEISKFEGVRVFKAQDESVQSGVLSFVHDSVSPDKLAYLLGQNGIAVRSGMHCAPLAHRSVGTENGTVRVSPSAFTTEKEAVKFIDSMKKILN